MAQPVWITPQGPLEGPIPEGVFFSKPLEAYDPDSGAVFFQLIAGNLPPGIQISKNGMMEGTPSVRGVPADVAGSVTSRFTVRAYTVTNRLADRTFTLTVTGAEPPRFTTPPGQIAQYFDSTEVNGLQIGYVDPDPGGGAVVTLIGGRLPPGLSISRAGVISGIIQPATIISAPSNFDMTAYDAYPFDFDSFSPSFGYEFTLRVFNNAASDVRSFSIFVWSRSELTADNEQITADNTFITADGVPFRTPIITTPEGSIGTVRNDNWYAFQFQVIDFDGDPYRFVATTPLPPGLELDPVTGFLYGNIPNTGISTDVYNFGIRVFKLFDPTIISQEYLFSLTITGPIDNNIVWITDSDLGSINNGDISTLYVEAVSVAGVELQYRLLSGSNSQLPQGLELLPSGEIAGRVSFNTFCLDGGTTTFDITRENGANPTTFDMTFTFTVNAYSVNGVINVTKTFTIRVIRLYNEPYENLYIQCMPPQNDRDFLSTLLEDSSVFLPNLIYRAQDANFGVARNVIYPHAYGLTSSTIETYYSALYENHYWKNLILGSLEIARATDNSGNVIYEVIYSRVIDNLLNNQGESVNKEVILPFPVLNEDSTEIQTVFPNSLTNMRDQVIDVVGQISNFLPRWMLSIQSDGRVLGFTPAWVIAYVKPGRGEQILYYLKQKIGDALNNIDFEVDRYEVDRSLSKNWDPATDHWIPTPPSYTTFDRTGTIVSWINFLDQTVLWRNSNLENFISPWTNATPPGTIFDGNSLQFTDPVDMYEDPVTASQYDKYLVFPKRNILE
jgi:hypothetical protein